MFDPFIEEEIIEDEMLFGTRRRRGSSGFRPGYGGGLGIDNDGDLVENFGNGFGIDLETGEPEIEIFPGFDIEL